MFCIFMFCVFLLYRNSEEKMMPIPSRMMRKSEAADIIEPRGLSGKYLERKISPRISTTIINENLRIK